MGNEYLTIKECLEKVIDNRGKTPPNVSERTSFELLEVNSVVGDSKIPRYSNVKRFVNQEIYETWFRNGHPIPGDILFSTVGSIAEVAISQGRGCIAQNLIALRPNTSILDSEFFYYWLRNPVTKQSLLSLDISSVQPSIKVPHLLACTIKLPPLFSQRAIARILGTLDDKIELNRRMNLTLESMARAIFKSWFVDFDPVRARIDGRPTTLDPKIAQLFPNAFQDSEIGQIPEGWECGRLDDLLVLQRGFDLPTKKRNPGPHPVFAAGGHHGEHDEFKVHGPGVVTGRSGVLGKVYYIHRDFWPLNTTLWVKEYRASTPIHAFFMLQTLELEAYNSGSAVPTLNRNHIHNLPVVVPPSPVVDYFDDLLRPLLQRCRQNELESESLAAIRDTLLPKLLSGEIAASKTARYTQ